MKNRIKKFYEDHVEAIFVFSCTVAGAAAAGLVIIKMVERENAVCCMKEWAHKETGETVIEVVQKNGKITLFDTINPPKP